MLKSFIAVAAFSVLAACTYLGGQSAETPDGPAITSEETAYAYIGFKGERATAAERALCEAAGGDVMRAGMLGWENCIQPMPDAGKACTTGSDCLDRCLLTDIDAAFGEPATGQCAATDNPFGCFQTVQDGLATPALCVD